MEAAKDLLEVQGMLNAARQVEWDAFQLMTRLWERHADPAQLEAARLSFERASESIDYIQARMARMKSLRQ